MSRFAAVPTAALDDDRLEALHIRVLTALCSYADKDGWCRVGQDQISKRARTNPARVSQCIGDLVSWGWLRRQRIGKMRVNVYQVLMDCDYDASIDLPTEQEQLAETANHMTCQPSKSELPSEQITLAETANPIGTPFSNTVQNTVFERAGASIPPNPEPKIRSGRVRGSARKTSLPDNWAPTITAYATASKLGMTREEINHEADQFRNSAIANGRTYADWDAAFRTWIGNNVKWRAERAAKRSVSTSPGGKSSRSSILTAGMRAVAELRGYGEPVSGVGGMGTGDVIEGELFGSDGFGQSGQDHRRLGRTGAD